MKKLILINFNFSFLLKKEYKLKTENMRIQFANNRLMESTDYSYEACVKYICHK